MRAGLAVMIVVLLSMASLAQANLVVYEPFDGYDAATLKGQKPSASTMGLDKNVATGYTMSSASTTYFAAQNQGLTFSDLQVNGGSLRVQANNNNGMGISAPITASAVTGDLFISYLANIDQISDSTGSRGVGVGTGDMSGNIGGNARFSAYVDTYPANNYAGAAYTGAANASNSGQALTGPTTNVTYLVLAKFTNVGITTTTANRANVYFWMLDAAQYDSFKAGGLTEQELNSATIGTGSGMVTARSTYSPSAGTAVVFDNSKFFTIAGWGNTSATQIEKATIDEIRYGTTLADVTPVAAPEPATMALLLSGLGLALVRRPRA